MDNSVLEKLFSEAVADVESGKQHACHTSQECRLMTGCVKCTPVVRGEIGVQHVEVFPGEDGVGILRITTSERHGGSPCVVSLRIPMTIHGRTR